MARTITPKIEKKLLRLIGAMADLQHAKDAWKRFAATNDSDLKYHLFISFVLAYARPFTENQGLGNLYVDYPEYKSGNPDEEAQKRHDRFMELRHTFVAHSSIVGMKLFIVPAGVASPISHRRMPYPDFAVGKRVFSDARYSAWLKVEVEDLSRRLSADIDKLLRCHCPRAGSLIPIETGADTFKWKK